MCYRKNLANHGKAQFFLFRFRRFYGLKTLTKESNLYFANYSFEYKSKENCNNENTKFRNIIIHQRE